MIPQSPRARQTSRILRLFPRFGVGLAIFLGLLTAGCGNRGPLYLPNAEETTATAIDDSGPHLQIIFGTDVVQINNLDFVDLTNGDLF